MFTIVGNKGSGEWLAIEENSWDSGCDKLG